MSKLLRDELRARDPRLTDWTSVLEWIELVGPGRIRDALPGELRDSPTHQVHVGHKDREWENETGGGMSYKARVVVRIGAVVLYRQVDSSSAAYESGESNRFEHTREAVYVAVPSDAVIINPREYDGSSNFFELRTSELTEVTQKEGPWWNVLLTEIRPYLNEKRRFEAAAAAEGERARVAMEQKQAERLRLAAEAVSAPRPLHRPSVARPAAATAFQRQARPLPAWVWVVAMAAIILLVTLIFA